MIYALFKGRIAPGVLPGLAGLFSVYKLMYYHAFRALLLALALAAFKAVGRYANYNSDLIAEDVCAAPNRLRVGISVGAADRPHLAGSATCGSRPLLCKIWVIVDKHVELHIAAALWISRTMRQVDGAGKAAELLPKRIHMIS